MPKLYFGQDVSTAPIVSRIGTSSVEFGFGVWGHLHEGRPMVLDAAGKFIPLCVPQDSGASAPGPKLSGRPSADSRLLLRLVGRVLGRPER